MQGNPPSRPTGHGGHYAELAHAMGSERERERKEGGEGRKEAGGPCWFNDGMEKVREGGGGGRGKGGYQIGGMGEKGRGQGRAMVAWRWSEDV